MRCGHSAHTLPRSLNKGIRDQISEFWPLKMLVLHYYGMEPVEETFDDPYKSAKKNPRKELNELRKQEGVRILNALLRNLGIH